jgi:hypothetical protein
MTGNEYQHKAIRTENRDYEGVKLRLHGDSLRQLLGNLKTLVATAKELDVSKKQLFYGKDVDFSCLTGEDVSDREIATAKVNLVTDRTLRLLHSILGLCTESGELAEMLLKTLDDVGSERLAPGEFDKPIIEGMDWIKEFGDVAWYLAQGTDAIPAPLDQVLTVNVEKLQRRYPDKFTEGLAKGHDSE